MKNTLSALRYNEGKPRYDLIPWHALPTNDDHPFLNDMSQFILKLARTENPNDDGDLILSCGMLLDDSMYMVSLPYLALVYEKGAVKYAPFNWYKGLTASDIMSSVSRHLKAFEVDEESEDIETSLPHPVHAAWGYITMLVFLREGRLVNDYFIGTDVSI